MSCEGLGGCCGDVSLGRWKAFKLWVESEIGLDLGPDCINITTGGGHSPTSKHYIGEAVDFDYDFVRVAHFLVPYAIGPDRLLDELFCADVGIAYSGGGVSGFHDACCHTHAALRPGATIPSTKRRDEIMGAYPLESVGPGERRTFRLLPPGGGAIGPVADPIYISLPFDEFGGGPASFRWAVCDQGGKVVDSNDADRNGTPPYACHTPGFLIQAHAGAFLLSIENHEPAGGRRTGQGLVEWQYATTGAAAAFEVPETAPAAQEQPEPTGAGGDEVTAAAEPPEPPSG